MEAYSMIWVVVFVHRGITNSVEVYADEVTARRRLTEIQADDFDWNEDDLSLFVGEVSSEFQRFPPANPEQKSTLLLQLIPRHIHLRIFGVKSLARIRR